MPEQGGKATHAVRRARRAACALAAFALVLTFSEAAAAETFCVSPKQSTLCSQTFTGLQAALDEATPVAGELARPDTILLGEAELGDGPYCYTADDALEIVGEGASRTVLTMPGPAEPCELPSAMQAASHPAVITLTNVALPPTSRITMSGIGIRIPASVGTRGMLVEGANVRDVDITADPGAVGPVGATLIWDSSFTSGSVTMPIESSPPSSGVDTRGPAFIQARIEAGIGVAAAAYPTNIARSRIEAITGVLSTGLTGIDSSLVTIADEQGSNEAPTVGLYEIGVRLDTERLPSILLARNVTVYGPGRGIGVAVETGERIVGEERRRIFGSASLISSIVDNFGLSLVRLANNGSNGVNTSYSNYPAGNSFDDGTGVGFIGEQNHLTEVPHFVDPAGGKFELTSGPLIDAGRPGTLESDASPLDLAGNPRILDGAISPGDPGCDHRSDVGAFELLPNTLLARAVASPGAIAGQPAELDGSASCDPNPAASLDYQWSFDDGGSASGRHVLHTFATPGLHRAELEVTSSDGRKQSTEVTVLVGEALPTGLGAPAGSSGSPATKPDEDAPRARRLDVRPRAFRAMGAGSSIARASGASVRYRLSEPASMRFRVERVVRRAGGGRRLERLRGSFTHGGRAGSNKFRFSGRLRGRKLRPGRYRLVATPIDPARNRGHSVRTPFRIARR